MIKKNLRIRPLESRQRQFYALDGAVGFKSVIGQAQHFKKVETRTWERYLCGTITMGRFNYILYTNLKRMKTTVDLRLIYQATIGEKYLDFPTTEPHFINLFKCPV